MENHSGFRFLGCLTLNTFPSRAPREMWEPSNGKAGHRQQSGLWVPADCSALHLPALDLCLLHKHCRGPQDPTDFWKCSLAVSLRGAGGTQL